jgi:hypothetical protein
VVGSDKRLLSIKCGEYFDYLRNCQLLNKPDIKMNLIRINRL